MPRRYPLLFAIALISLVGSLAYSNCFGVPFVYDDVTSIVQNRVIRDLPAFLQGEGLRFNPRRFVTYLSLAINYRLGGLDVTGYHVFNLAVHLITAVTLYLFALVTLKTPRLCSSRLARHAWWVALFSALLFVAHPLQTEAVTYVVQRTTSLAAFFYLLCLLLYALARGKESRLPAVPLFAGSLVSALLAMLCKEIAATLPLAVLLYEVSFFTSSWRSRLRLLLPLSVLLSVVPLALLSGGRPAGELLSVADRMTRETALISRTQYLLTQFKVIAAYLRQLFVPYGQNIDHDIPLATGFLAADVLPAFLLLAALLAFAGWLYRNGTRDAAWRLVGFGIFWFFLTLLVESSLIPIRDVMNEHRLYLPSIGIALAVSTALVLALGSRPRVLLGLGSLLVAALGFATWQRNWVWQSELTLWQDAVRKSPDKGRPLHNYAKALSEAGEHGKAILHYQMAIRRGLASPDTLVNLAAEYEQIGEPHRAVEYYRLALTGDPSQVTALTRLAIALLQRPESAAEGLSILQQAVRVAPDNANVHFNLGTALEAQGKVPDAKEHYLRAVSLDPGYAKAHYSLALLYHKEGRADLAERHFRKAQQLEGNNP